MMFEEFFYPGARSYIEFAKEFPTSAANVCDKAGKWIFGRSKSTHYTITPEFMTELADAMENSSAECMQNCIDARGWFNAEDIVRVCWKMIKTISDTYALMTRIKNDMGAHDSIYKELFEFFSSRIYEREFTCDFSVKIVTEAEAMAAKAAKAAAKAAVAAETAEADAAEAAEADAAETAEADAAETAAAETAVAEAATKAAAAETAEAEAKSERKRKRDEARVADAMK